jgi:hypothetical protein
MRRKRWLRWTLLVVAVLLGGSEAFSRVLHTRAARRYLTGRLQSSFGRPVEVGGFDFSLLDGPRIEILGVSVADDPRFGNEYFLRAEKLTAGPRWSALFTGRFEFGTLSFTRPSLNLVRMADGRWNLEGWLPPARAPGREPASSPGLPFHLMRIDVDSGRVNFKQGNDVRPFALVDVTGYVQQEGPGRWSLDLEAEPMHAGEAQPQTGMLRVRGSIGGTTSRLRPAQLELSWWGASLEDALRLIKGRDYGVRGTLAADLTAHVEGISPAGTRAVGPPAPAQWDVSGTVWLTGAHRWDFPARATDPPVNVLFKALWRQGDRRVSFPSLQVVSPGSNLNVSADVDWTHSVHPHLEIASAEIAMGDVLAWYRAFRAGVADDLVAHGSVRASCKLDGWPPRLLAASLSSGGGSLSAGTQPRILRWAPWSSATARGTLSSGPIAVQFVSNAGNAGAAPLAPLNVQFDLLPTAETAASQRAGAAVSARGPASAWPFRASLEGSAGRAEDWAWLLREIGHPTNQMWSAEGTIVMHLKGQGTLWPLVADWRGSAEARALSLQLAFLNQPLRFPKATYEFGSGARKLTLDGAQGLDASWKGTISRNAPGGDWEFDLTADHLDAAALDRWLGPRARPSFLARFLGAAPIAGQEPGPPVPIRAHGRLRVGQFTLGSLQLSKLDAGADIAGRRIVLQHAKADFAGGSVQGDFTAALGSGPAYELHAQVQRVNLAALAGVVPALVDRISGVAAGEIALRASGVGRDALLTSLEGEGTLSARNAELRRFNLGSPSAGPTAETAARYSEAGARFRIASRKVAAVPLRLGRPGEGLVLTGTVDFNGVMDFRVAPSRSGAASNQAIPEAIGSYRLSGTLADPQIGRLETPTAKTTSPPSRVGSKAARP